MKTSTLVRISEYLLSIICWPFGADMSSVNINRYVGANLQGYAAIKITVQSDTADACSVVTSILSAAVGTVTGIGGAFFGIAGDLTCNLASS